MARASIGDVDESELEALLTSRVWDRQYTLALGRIVELTAANEALMRALLGRALRIPQSNLGRHQYTHAAFVGVRTAELARRLRGLAELDGVSPWVTGAADWARRAAAASERRDALVHREPIFIATGSAGMVAGLGPARRNQVAEPLDDQAIGLLRDLVRLDAEGLQVAIASHRDETVPRFT